MHLMQSNETDTTTEAAPKLERLAYTKSELGQALGLSPVTIYRLEQRGLLRPVEGIRHKLFSVTEVNRFLARGAA